MLLHTRGGQVHDFVGAAESHKGGVMLRGLLLWAAGNRPVTISKFGVGMAALHPQLPANKWNRTLRRYFGWTPLVAD